MVMNVISELLLVFLHPFSLVFLDDAMTEDESMSRGFIMVAVVSVYLLVNWGIVIFVTIKNICIKRRAKKLE
jgi:hypothetical protein